MCIKGEILIISFTFIIQKWALYEMAPAPAIWLDLTMRFIAKSEGTT